MVSPEEVANSQNDTAIQDPKKDHEAVVDFRAELGTILLKVTAGAAGYDTRKKVQLKINRIIKLTHGKLSTTDYTEFSDMVERILTSPSLNSMVSEVVVAPTPSVLQVADNNRADQDAPPNRRIFDIKGPQAFILQRISHYNSLLSTISGSLAQDERKKIEAEIQEQFPVDTELRDSVSKLRELREEIESEITLIDSVSPSSVDSARDKAAEISKLNSVINAASDVISQFELLETEVWKISAANDIGESAGMEIISRKTPDVVGLSPKDSINAIINFLEELQAARSSLIGKIEQMRGSDGQGQDRAAFIEEKYLVEIEAKIEEAEDVVASFWKQHAADLYEQLNPSSPESLLSTINNIEKGLRIEEINSAKQAVSAATRELSRLAEAKSNGASVTDSEILIAQKRLDEVQKLLESVDLRMAVARQVGEVNRLALELEEGGLATAEELDQAKKILQELEINLKQSSISPQEFLVIYKDLSEKWNQLQQEVDDTFSRTEFASGENRILKLVNSELIAIQLRLEAIASRLDLTKNVDFRLHRESLMKSSAAFAIDFFNSGQAATKRRIPEYRDMAWMNYTPERLACAVWDYAMHLIDVNANGQNVFVPLSLFDKTIPINDKPNIDVLIKGFGNLGVVFPDDPDRAAKFAPLAGKLAVDFSRMEKIHAFGCGVSSADSSNDSATLINFLLSDAGRMTAQEFQRIFEIGSGYLDVEGSGVTHGSLILSGLKMWEFINEPTRYDAGIFAGTRPGEKPTVLRHVLEKNPLTDHPAVVEGRVGARGRSVRIFAKRYLQRLILGKINDGESIPWEVEFAAEIARKRDAQGRPTETLSEQAARKLKIGTKWFTRELYGTEKPGKNNIGEIVGEPGSFYEKFLMTDVVGGGHSTTEIFGADSRHFDNYDVIYAQHHSELLATYWGLHYKAEGQKLVKRTGKTELDAWFPMVDRASGPTSATTGGIPKGFTSATCYSGKLSENTLEGFQGSDGSVAPRNTWDLFFAFFQTMLDRYWYIPDGEREGITLRERLLLSPDVKNFLKTQFKDAISAEENILPWQEQIELSYNLYKLFWYGSGKNWHTIIRQAKHGASGNEFDPSLADYVKKMFSRNANYVLTRDRGRETFTWTNDEEYQKFNAVRIWLEKWWKSGPDNDISRRKKLYVPPKPKSVPAKTTGGEIYDLPVTDLLWEQAVEFTKKPTKYHRHVDGRKPGPTRPQSVTRIATNIDEFMYVPDDVARMTPLQRLILESPMNNEIMKLQKLFIAYFFIGDVYREQNTKQMSDQDILAFYALFSFRFWKESEEFTHLKVPKIYKKMLIQLRDFIESKAADPIYNGLGYFSVEEVTEMLKAAGIPMGLMQTVNAFQEVAKSMRT
ncbi:MAG: hypothetical protein COY80_03595 [Candidatus Pacebacteria bacterium CG_4_10_14_0_8_um_filter_42_14]|nr:MAG: hypothetical protein COY80_03595 [Candidatus Pacebacteria bacterium CG_4_10_14_0_8_um_filter_42_14]